MKFIDNRSITDPRINLAIEEYALRNLPQDNEYLLFYVNEPSIIIGKNQNTIEEINEQYVREHGIHVVRRLSGGGAVYHDFGNLNFSFITDDDGKSFLNFKKFTRPVVEALQSLGVNAEMTGRNDLQIGERKISGNAQYSSKGRMFSHGTLMLDSEIEHVVAALKVNETKIQSKAIKSIRSRVANIAEYLSEPLTVEQLKQMILQHIFQNGAVDEYILTEQDWDKIHELSELRYKKWEWNYGKSPKSNFNQTKRFPFGTVEVKLWIEKGFMQDVKFYGDFFGTEDISLLENQFIGKKYDYEAIDKVLKENQLNVFFGVADADAILELFFQ